MKLTSLACLAAPSLYTVSYDSKRRSLFHGSLVREASEKRGKGLEEEGRRREKGERHTYGGKNVPITDRKMGDSNHR